MNAGPLEELIKKYELIVNNNTDFPTRPSSPGISIIDLVLTSPDLGPILMWEIPKEYPSLSDHELILIEWENTDIPGHKNTQTAMTGWNIRNLLKDNQLLEAAKSDWKKLNDNHQCLDLLYAKKELDKKVEWFEEKLTGFLNKYAKITQITSYSKHGWNKEVAEVGSAWAKDKKRFGRNEDLKEEFKQAQNCYFEIIKKAKRECWQKFLQGDSNLSMPLMDKNHCQTALKYTKPLQFKTTLTLKDGDGNIAVSMKAKEALVRRLVFPKPSPNLLKPPITPCKLAHIKITGETVAEALSTQAATKAPGPNKINF